jgi:hypothetical protein
MNETGNVFLQAKVPFGLNRSRNRRNNFDRSKNCSQGSAFRRPRRSSRMLFSSKL